MTPSTDARRAASWSAPGTSNGTFAAPSVRFRRTMRCAIVASGTRNARAISSVVRPPSRRRVSATRASVDSTGWQAVKTSRSRSSPIASSCAAPSASTKSGYDVGLLRLEVAAELLVLARVQRVLGAGGRARGSWRSPSATLPGCPAPRRSASARARRRGRPGPAPRRGRRRARAARRRRSPWPTRSARPPRSPDGLPLRHVAVSSAAARSDPSRPAPRCGRRDPRSRAHT
jgi:hypothetical protein